MPGGQYKNETAPRGHAANAASDKQADADFLPTGVLSFPQPSRQLSKPQQGVILLPGTKHEDRFACQVAGPSRASTSLTRRLLT